MATYEIISWRGVPALIEARDERGTVTRPLGERFQMLIDAAAMQVGLDAADAYLDEWSRGPAVDAPGTAEAVAEAVAADLENRLPEFIGLAYRRP
jgi:hypothetical protein